MQSHYHLRTLIYVTLALGLLAFPIMGFARLNITLTDLNPYTGEHNGAKAKSSILLRGEIAIGDYERVLKFIELHVVAFTDSRHFILSSKGGSISEAIKIADLIESTYARISVGAASGECVSACFLLFIAAPERNATANYVGVHRPYLPRERLGKLPPLKAKRAQTLAMTETRKFLDEHGTPNYLIEKMFHRASNQVYWLSDRDLQNIGRRASWYDQYLVARCDLDKNAEREYFQGGNNFLLDGLIKATTCGSESTRKQAMKELRTRSQQLRSRMLETGNQIDFTHIAKVQDVSTWAEVAQNNVFKGYAPREKQATEAQYWAEVVAPFFSVQDRREGRRRFRDYARSVKQD